MSEDEALAPGTCVHRYEILRKLGAGGMGVVYEARDTALGRLVGLKLVRPRGDDSIAAADRFLREAQALARISHPNVLTVHDVGTFEGRPYYAMELMEGGTLRDWLQDRRRSPREIAQVFLQAARGLAAAHAAGLVHRDFKPDNVLVGSDGGVRVADFGLVHLAGPTEMGLTPQPVSPSGTGEGGIVGTPGYMAPEQLLGRATDARADQFSYCVSLYEALYGQGPFRWEAAADVDTRVLQAAAVLTGSVRPASRSRVPGWLRRIVLRGLSVDPSARWPSLDAVVRLLERGLRRRRWVWAVAAAAVLAAATSVTIASDRGRTPAPDWRPEVIGVESEGNPAREGTISQDGKVLAYTSHREVWIQRRGAAERSPVRLDGAFKVMDLALSPEGERLFVTLQRLGALEGELWRIELPGGSSERIYAPPGVLPGLLDVAPDGQTLALTERDTRLRERLVLLAPGRDARSLADVGPGEGLRSPAFSPDGRRVAFVRSSPPSTTSLEWADVDTGRLTRLATPSNRVVDWSSDDTLLVDAGGGVVDRVRVRELVVADDGRIVAERDVYSTAGGVNIWRLEWTRAGVFLQRDPADPQRRVATLDLTATAPKLEVLPTGSEADLQAAGWLPSGDMVIAARVAGHNSVLAGNRDRGFKEVGAIRDLGWPTGIWGDRVIYGRSDTEGNEVTILVGGLAPPLTSLTRLHRLDRIACAGEVKEPCLLAKKSANETIAYQWNSRTGERGREVYRWEGNPRYAALSHDGGKLAFVAQNGSVMTVALRGGPPTVVIPPSEFRHQYLAWAPDGTLLASRCCVPHALVRVDPSGRSAILAVTGTQWVGYPVVSPDGTTVAVSVYETAQTFLWVPAPR